MSNTANTSMTSSRTWTQVGYGCSYGADAFSAVRLCNQFSLNLPEGYLTSIVLMSLLTTACRCCVDGGSLGFWCRRKLPVVQLVEHPRVNGR